MRYYFFICYELVTPKFTPLVCIQNVQNEMGNSKMPPKWQKNFTPTPSGTPPPPPACPCCRGWCLELNCSASHGLTAWPQCPCPPSCLVQGWL